MHNKFNERARRAMALANHEAIKLHHDYLAPVHILLAILSLDHAVATMVLKHLGVDLDTLREDVKSSVKPGNKELHQVKMAQRADTRKCLHFAIDEARKLGHHYVGTEHILLGILREGHNIPADALTQHGVKIEAVREDILEHLASIDHDQHHGITTSQNPIEWLHQQELSKAFRSTRFWHILVLAVDAANRLGHGEIEDEHLLLALLREEDSPVAKMLAPKGVSLDWVRDELTKDQVVVPVPAE